MIVDYSLQNASQIYYLMSQSIIPRPIAWIVTQNRDKVVNIAPFSYFSPLSSNPPTLVVSIGHKSDKTPKDTLKNIRESKVCTICMPRENDLEKLDKSARELDENISEAKLFDIKTKVLNELFPPVIETSAVAFFCEFSKEIALDKSKTVPIVFKIKKQYIDDRFCKKESGKIYVDYKPLARVGKSYGLINLL